MNAPFWMLNKIVDKVVIDWAKATVIIPWWPEQVWNQKLVKLSISVPLKIPNDLRVMS